MQKRELYMDKFYLNKFKNYLQENDKSEKTINNYIDNVILFTQYFNQTESEEFDPLIVTSIDIKDYRSYCQTTLKLGVASINLRIASVKSYFNYLYLDKITTKNPSLNIKKIKDNRMLEPKAFSENIYRKLRREYYRSGNPLHILIFELLSHCGLRANELVNITLEDINMNMDIKNDTPRTGELTVQGKGNRIRVIPLHKDVRIAIINWIDIRKHKKIDSSYLLISERNDKYTTNGIYRIIMKYHSKLNLEQHYTVHSYRHYFCKHLLLEANVNISTVSALAGHASIVTTHKYTIATKKDMDDAINRF